MDLQRSSLPCSFPSSWCSSVSKVYTASSICCSKKHRVSTSGGPRRALLGALGRQDEPIHRQGSQQPCLVSMGSTMRTEGAGVALSPCPSCSAWGTQDLGFVPPPGPRPTCLMWIWALCLKTEVLETSNRCWRPSSFSCSIFS